MIQKLVEEAIFILDHLEPIVGSFELSIALDNLSSALDEGETMDEVDVPLVQELREKMNLLVGDIREMPSRARLDWKTFVFDVGKERWPDAEKHWWWHLLSADTKS